MKILPNAILICLVGTLFCGCSSRHAGPVYRAGDENPPDFLAGPMSMVLTNLNGFSATVTSTVTMADGAMHSKSGALLGRDGRLIFQPMLGLKKKRAQTEGGLFFIWDATRHTGYVLSEALQGYAPIDSSIMETGPLEITKEGIQEVINGHPCHKSEADVTLASGRKVRLTLWRADDLGHFPIRIESVNGMERMFLNLSDVRQESPPSELFLPPDGFTAYTSGTRLMNELILRDASYAKKSQTLSESDEPGDTRPTEWHDSAVGAPMGHP